MTAFALKIVTPDGLKYDGMAEELIVRSTTGDIGIMAGHINCVVPLGMGQAMAIIDGIKKYAACIGGMMSVIDGKVTLVPTTFEWADSIDKDRSLASESRARAVLADKSSSQTDIKLAEARLKRALIRQSVAEKK
ncbi:MAG: F0F1 ATP synthase subunit epsilon [Oscillospiraceae bacterium]|nr:F0F1 ATP synthase subunit epsilon [Oscillospiraceae bacterium]